MLTLADVVDIAQTFAMLILAGALVWTVRGLKMELRLGGQAQHAVLESLEALRQRVRDLEEDREFRVQRKIAKRRVTPAQPPA